LFKFDELGTCAMASLPSSGLYNNPDDKGSLGSSYDWTFDAEWHCAEWRAAAAGHAKRRLECGGVVVAPELGKRAAPFECSARSALPIASEIARRGLRSADSQEESASTPEARPLAFVVFPPNAKSG
jgi:hypothetical protein